MPEFSAAPAGLGLFCVLPAVKTAGYFWSSLRDYYGARRSRWGWWSRFQRLKAASLVSVKSNGSAGDSTWLSQNTTLALPSHVKSEDFIFRVWKAADGARTSTIHS